MSDKPREGVGALIYSRKTHRYLFLLRSKPKTPQWGIVGGKIESGESVLHALTREISEEIGQDFSSQKFIPLETFTSEDQKFVFYTFVTSVEEEFVPILNSEHFGYCWVPITSSPKPLHPGLWQSFKFGVIKKKLKTLETILD